MRSDFYELRCISCREKSPESESYTNCAKCGAPLEVRFDYDQIAERLNMHALQTAPLRATKYVDFYPVWDRRNIVSLDEGGTPLYRCTNLGKTMGLRNLYIKYEGANPTGAFKDRGTMVELSKAKELDKKAIAVASSGNMAASVSAFSAKANMPCYVLVPQGTPIGKLSQTLSYGARIIQVRGTYDMAAKLTEEISMKHGYYLAGDYAYRLEGQKSQAFEIAEQLGWKAPDRMFVPIGCGTNGSALWKGFKEFKEMEITGSTPRMVGVQAKGSDPVVRALSKGLDDIPPIKNPRTVASAICVGDPLDGLKILRAIRESEGSAYSVEDNDTLEAQKLLAKKESVFVEPASASSLACLQGMLDAGEIDRDESIVISMTGIGLKDPISALKVLYSPPVIEPDPSEVEKYLNYGFYNVVASNSNKKKVVFTDTPSSSDLRKKIREEFDTTLSDEDLEECRGLIEEFMEKGKEILKGDLQYILEKAIRRSSVHKDLALKILDYDVTASKHDKSTGTIRFTYRGREDKVSADGVGPVDCMVNAIKKALAKNGFAFELTDYNVSISEGGTDASVNVKMALEDENKNRIISMGTSPDIIAASVEAFEEGYNILYQKNR